MGEPWKLHLWNCYKGTGSWRNNGFKAGCSWTCLCSIHCSWAVTSGPDIIAPGYCVDCADCCTRSYGRVILMLPCRQTLWADQLAMIVLCLNVHWGTRRTIGGIADTYVKCTWNKSQIPDTMIWQRLDNCVLHLFPFLPRHKARFHFPASLVACVIIWVLTNGMWMEVKKSTSRSGP